MNSIKEKWALLIAIVFTFASLGFVSNSTAAQQAFNPKNIQTDVSLTVTNQYVWRGRADNTTKNDICLQPSLTFSYGNAYVNIWQNIDTANWGKKDDALTETDMTVGYGKDLGPYYVEAGYTYYAYDQQKDGQEIYISGQMSKTFLKPTITVYQDFAHYPATFINLSLYHSVNVYGDTRLDLTASGDYLISGDLKQYPDNDGKHKFNGFYDGLLSASLNIPVTQSISVIPQISWCFPITGDAKDLVDNYVYGAITIDMVF